MEESKKSKRKSVKTEIEDKYNVILDDTDFCLSIIKYYKKYKQLSEKQIGCLEKKVK